MNEFSVFAFARGRQIGQRGKERKRDRKREREKKYREIAMCIEKTGQNKGTAARVLPRANYAARHVELEIVIGIGQGHLHMPDNDKERELTNCTGKQAAR